MKKPGFIPRVLLVASALAILIPMNVVAAPATKKEAGISVFNGNWVSTRDSEGVETAQSLNIRCNPKKNTCRIKYVVERSGSCSRLYGDGDPIGLVNKYHGSFDVEDVEVGTKILSTEVSEAYCRTNPPIEHGAHTLYYIYNETLDTLEDFGADDWTRK